MNNITVYLPLPFQRITGGKSVLAVSAQTIAELIDVLEAEFPGVKRLLAYEGKIQKFISVYVNDRDTRFSEGIETPLKNGDVVTIVSAVSGG